jgi:hypothetical protein
VGRAGLRAVFHHLLQGALCPVHLHIYPGKGGREGS